jgi:hypothetical protein
VHGGRGARWRRHHGLRLGFRLFEGEAVRKLQLQKMVGDDGRTDSGQQDGMTPSRSRMVDGQD